MVRGAWEGGEDGAIKERQTGAEGEVKEGHAGARKGEMKGGHVGPGDDLECSGSNTRLDLRNMETEHGTKSSQRTTILQSSQLMAVSRTACVT